MTNYDAGDVLTVHGGAPLNGALRVRGAKNLASSQWLAPEGLNVYDVLRHEVVVMSRAAVEQVQQALKD